MSHLPLDARAILHYLNDLGYRNITAEQLREFLKDLRKLIKYDERMTQLEKPNYFEDLHKRTTASYRAKMSRDGADNKENHNNEASTSSKVKRNPSEHKEERSDGGTNLADLTRIFREQLALEPIADHNGKTLVAERRSRSRLRKQIASEGEAREISSSSSPVHYNGKVNVTRKRRTSKKRSTSACETRKGESTVNAPRSILIPSQRSRSRKYATGDPVELYQYYKNEWEYFRNQIPGENAHNQLRWQIRYKLLDPK